MHRNVILTNKRRTHTQSNYTSTKLKACFRRLLRHPARKWSGPILHPETHTWPSSMWSVVDVDIGDREQLRSLMSELKILIHIGSHLNILNLLGAVTAEISVGL